VSVDHILVLVLGLACAGAGGELFVRGAVGVASSLRIPPGIVGATVAAFATSSPELAVAIGSALAGEPELALGDALGSNVVNIGLVLGVAVLVGPIRIGGGAISRDLAAAIAIPVVTVVLAVDGRLGRPDAVVLLAVFAIWLGATLVEARRERSATPDVLGERVLGRAVPAGLVGLLLLVAAGRLIVSGARGVGDDLGLDAFVVGVVLVAIGTSMPELATAVIARLRGHEEIGLGTVLGSNVYNGAAIVPVAALIAPITVAWSEVAVSLVFGILVVSLLLPAFGHVLGRRRGAVLVLLYVSSVVTLLVTNG
jgi:cation:H+ antiporter